MNKRVFLSSPHIGDDEREFVSQAFDSNYVAPLGPHVDEFEKTVANYIGVAGAAAFCSGTAAIHLALKLVGVEKGDIVFCSSLTFSGSCNPIMYQNGTPVFIDCEPQSYNMSPVALERAFAKYPKPKAVIIVNLYGQSADYDELSDICERHGVPIIEDAAESFGATYKGRQTGTFGRFGILSFNGNKIITTSGGGMLLSNDEKALQKAKFWATQARDSAPYYLHSELGYNYRLSNICAAIGCGQMKVLDDRIAKKKYIFERYKDAFSHIEAIKMYPVCNYGKPNYWLSVMELSTGCGLTPADIIAALEAQNIESRHIWNPMHLQPFYQKYDFFSHFEKKQSVAEQLFYQGVCLPSDTKMTDEEIDRVIDIINNKLLN